MSEGIGPVVTFGIGDDVYAVAVSRVQEILEMDSIRHLPGSPKHVMGLIDVRGEGISVVDLRRVMGLPAGVDDEATRIIVVWIGAAGRQARIAMRTDRVFEVTTLDGDRTEPVPEAELLRWDDTLLAGIGRRDGAFVALLDLDRMIDPAGPAPTPRGRTVGESRSGHVAARAGAGPGSLPVARATVAPA